MSDKIKNQLEVLKQQEKELTALYRHVAIKFGISDSEFWVLYALMISEVEYTQQTISRLWSLPKQTVNSVISNLTKKGYVYLETVLGTRNRKIIRLTEAGKEFSEKNLMNTYEAEQRAISKMSEVERETCIEIFGKYINLLREEIIEKLLCEA
jgi:DNA-binding MarR family transcriptional regulator